MKYFSIYDNDTCGFLATGLNSTSLEDVVQSYKSLDVDLEENLSDEQVIQSMNNVNYSIEEHDEPIEETVLWGDDDWF